MHMTLDPRYSVLFKDLCHKNVMEFPPLLKRLEEFDFDSYNNFDQMLEDFIRKALRPFVLIANVALQMAEEPKSVDADLEKWFFDLSELVDSRLIANPKFEPTDRDTQRLALAAADLAHAAHVIDLYNSCVMNDFPAENQ